MPKKHSITPRYFEKMSDHVGECWLWKGYVQSSGYGQMYIEGKRILAHRASWSAANGDIPEGMLVCHKCDTPRCVNPDHLFLGTHKNNMDDCMNKNRAFIQNEGRDFSFTRKPRVKKLTQHDVESIRASVESLAVLAARHNVSLPCISLVRRGKRK